MSADHNVCAAARKFDQEQPIGPFEDSMLGALEAHDQTHAAWNATRQALAPLFARVLSAWLYPGAVIDTHDRTGKLPRCLWSVRVGSGNARSATKFRIIGAPSVRVEDEGDPSMSEWSVRAIAISSKTGLEMSGNTPNRRTLTDGSVTLTGHAFHMGFSDLRGDALRQKERDDFIRMVAEAESILAERANGGAE